jgi:hypothetical protein
MRIRCPQCTATIGEYALGNIVVRHRGRLVAMTATGVQALQCWRCGMTYDGERIRSLISSKRSEHAERTQDPDGTATTQGG